MSMNMRNYGIGTGRLTEDPRIFTNADGSKKVRITLACQNNFKEKDGTRKSQFLPMERFIPANGDLGPYEGLGKGDLVTVQYSLRNNNYTDKSGVAHYDLTVQIEQITMLEPKTTTDNRKAQRALAAAGQAPAMEAAAE